VDRDTVLGIIASDRNDAIKEFIEFHNYGDHDEFIEYPEEEKQLKEISNENEALNYVSSFLQEKANTIDLLIIKRDSVLRNELIRHLKERSSLSIRQIANVLSINRGMVERLKI
jgi:DNA-binding transcriptional regulator YiaG